MLHLIGHPRILSSFLGLPLSFSLPAKRLSLYPVTAAHGDNILSPSGEEIKGQVFPKV